MSSGFVLDDMEWTLVEPLLAKGLCEARRTDDLRVKNFIFKVLRARFPWRGLRARYYRYTSCYYLYFCRTKLGVWKQISDSLARYSYHF